MTDAKLDQVVEELKFVLSQLSSVERSLATRGLTDTAGSINSCAFRLRGIQAIVQQRSAELVSPAEEYADKVASIQEEMYEEGWVSGENGRVTGRVSFGHRTTEK